MNPRMGEVLEIDERLCYGGTPHKGCVDLAKLDYQLPTVMDKYKQEHGSGFNDLAWDIIELYEYRKSNNDFKRQLKRLHAEHKNNKCRL